MPEVRTDGAEHPAGPPKRIGRYEITGRLGKGAMGIVYSARDEAMNRPVAVKVLMADLEGDPDVRARFTREAKLAGRLIHRNVVTIFDVGEEDGRLFIVMELLQGQTLGKLIKAEQALALEAKIDVMLELLEGLGEAHARGVVHRDIKPSNLFIQRDGSVKIVDFGIARVASSNLTSTGFLIGTPDFMSPEQARGDDIDQRSDLFSAGTVLYLLLANKRPFTAPDLPGILSNVERADPPPIPESDAPQALQRVLKRALAKEPSERYQQAAEMLADLQRFRRQFEQSTRQLALSTAKAWEELAAILDGLAHEADALQIVSQVPRDVVGAAGLAERFPVLVERGVGGVTGGLVHRRDLTEVAARLDGVRQTVGFLASNIAEARIHLGAADRALEASQPAAALPYLDAVLESFPSSDAIRTKRAACRADVVAVERVQELLGRAGSARDRGAWKEAFALCDRAAAIGRAADLVADERARIETDRSRADGDHEEKERRREAQLTALMNRAHAARRAGQWAVCTWLIEQARLLVPMSSQNDARIEAAATELAAGLAADRAGTALREQSARCVAQARAMLATDPARALASLEQFIKDHPTSASARSEFEALSAEMRRVAAARARVIAEATAMADAAQREVERRQASLDEAKADLERALAAMRASDSTLDPNPDASLAAFRAESVRPLLEAARAAHANGNFAEARAKAEEALIVTGDNQQAAIIQAAAQAAMESEMAGDTEATLALNTPVPLNMPVEPPEQDATSNTVVFNLHSILKELGKPGGGRTE